MPMPAFFWPTLSVLLAIALAVQWFRHRTRAVPPPRKPPENSRALKVLAAFRKAANAMPEGLALLEGENRRLGWFNASAAKLLALRWPDDLNGPLSQLEALPEATAWFTTDTSEALELSSPPFQPGRTLNVRIVRADPARALLIVQDATKLSRLEQIRRDFVANVSHELRTPLTVIHGYLDLLSPEDSPELAPVLQEMRTQSQRMSQIVEDLLTISRLEAQESAEHERVAMSPLITSLHREAKALSRGQHVIECEDAALCDLWGSQKDLHSAFSNLVSNAVRYTPAGGRIVILFERFAEGVRLRVSDTGHGIPAEHIPRLSERFYRVSTSRSREHGGTGLGLAIVKHVLHLHGARLTIESQAGRGSDFSCVFGAESVLEREDGAFQFTHPRWPPVVAARGDSAAFRRRTS